MLKHTFILITSELETKNDLQSYHHNMKKKTLKASSKQKIYLIKNKKPKIFVFGRIRKIPYDPIQYYTILCTILPFL